MLLPTATRQRNDDAVFVSAAVCLKPTVEKSIFDVETGRRQNGNFSFSPKAWFAQVTNSKKSTLYTFILRLFITITVISLTSASPFC